MSESHNDQFIVTRPSDSYHKVINPRRGPTASVPGLTLAAGLSMGDKILGHFGLDQYVGCVTAEPERRAIPFVFNSLETAALTALYKEWAPYIWARLVSELHAPVQTYNKVSRLGWPIFANPENKDVFLHKWFAPLRRGDLTPFERAFIIINVRLQAEARDKARANKFIRNVGTTYEADIGRTERTIEVKGVGQRVCSRVRAIFNMPMPNLYKQVLDTAVHNVFLKYPAFHHDMFNGRLLPVEGSHLCFDVKHFERFTADAVRHRATGVIGGFYGEIGRLFEEIPFLVPSDDWSNEYFVRINRQGGWSDQFASGDSAVAPVQKEIFTALYGEYFKRTRGVSYEEAINLVFQGGDGRLTIRNYGDDNSISGDKDEMDSVLSHLQGYLKAEEEVPPKFLGFVWYEGLGWKLPPSSYLLKTYLNERAPGRSIRKYPNLGWVQKREVFTKLGHPDIATNIFPYEDKLLRDYGLTWSMVVRRAEEERLLTLGYTGLNNMNYILEKDWAMTAEEKLATGEFFGIMPEETAPIIKQLLDKSHHKHLKW